MQEEQLPTLEHPSKTTKVVNKLVVAALLLVLISLGVIFRWSFQSEDVLKVNNSPFPSRVIADPTTGSSIIVLGVDYCKTQRVDGTIRMSYVSQSREVFLPLQKERIPIGCNKADFPVVVPKDLAADTYKIKFRVTYDINPLKKGVISDFESQSFKIGAGATPIPQ